MVLRNRKTHRSYQDFSVKFFCFVLFLYAVEIELPHSVRLFLFHVPSNKNFCECTHLVYQREMKNCFELGL